jgi:uncharacterized FlaG/YvyC family protein
MKIDLVKALQENEMYQSALSGMTEEERARAKAQIEGMMGELTRVVQTFVEQVQASDDATQRDFKIAVDDADVVIHEIPHASGSHG